MNRKVRFVSEKIFSLYGEVRRARGPFLYTSKNVRLVDLYQEGGRAILGWGGGSAFTMLKNALNRGVTGSFKTHSSERMIKAVSALLGGQRNIFVFPDYGEAAMAASVLNLEAKSYMPWSPEKTDWKTEKAVVVAPPLPWTDSMCVLALDSSVQIEEDVLVKFREFEIKLPAPVEEGISRSIYDLIAALKNRQEKDWFIYDTVLTKYWVRKGPWLEPKVPQEVYPEFVMHCLNLGIIINPEYRAMSLVPYGADRGVFEVLKKHPFEWN